MKMIFSVGLTALFVTLVSIGCQVPSRTDTNAPVLVREGRDTLKSGERFLFGDTVWFVAPSHFKSGGAVAEWHNGEEEGWLPITVLLVQDTHWLLVLPGAEVSVFPLSHASVRLRTLSSDSLYTITPLHFKKVKMRKPCPGTTLHMGEKVVVEWAATEKQFDVTLEVSTDSGRTFQLLKSESIAPATTQGQWEWTVGQEAETVSYPSNVCLLRVVGYNENEARDLTPGIFSVISP